jgi:hypothetical protein
MDWELGTGPIQMNNWMKTEPNQLRLLQYLVYAPATGEWGPDTYDALQVQITKFKYGDEYSFSMKHDLFRQLVAQEGQVPQWLKDGDAFLARSGLNDVIKSANYAMIIYASARAYENNRAFERKYADVDSSNILSKNGGDIDSKGIGNYLSGKAPTQVTPGMRELTGQYVNDMGKVQPWKAYYDEYGRLIGRTDYNAGNIAAGIPDIHYHTYEYEPGKNRSPVLDHVPGEYIP